MMFVTWAEISLGMFSSHNGLGDALLRRSGDNNIMPETPGCERTAYALLPC